jgi:hypothetical protein
VQEFYAKQIIILLQKLVPDSNGLDVVSVLQPRGNHAVSHWMSGLVEPTTTPVAQENLLPLSEAEPHVQ